MHPPHDDVVEHRTVVVEQMGVLRATRGDLAEVVGQRVLKPLAGVCTRDTDGAEMADVEGDRVVTARHVLRDRARGIRERHLPTAEVDHLGAERAMCCVEWRVAQVAHEPGSAGVSSMPNRWTSAA